MIHLVVRIEGTTHVQDFYNLTLKELGQTLATFGEKYHLVFETVREVDPDIGCTMYIGAIEKVR